MKASEIIRLAKNGRPDLAAINLGASGAGAWNKPVRLLSIIRKYPHSSGAHMEFAYLANCWLEGRASRDAI